MPVSKSTKTKVKTLADKKHVALERTELERVVVERLISEAAELPGVMTSIFRSKEYENMVALHKPLTWSLVVRARAPRGKAFLEVGTDLLTERP